MYVPNAMDKANKEDRKRRRNLKKQQVYRQTNISRHYWNNIIGFSSLQEPVEKAEVCEWLKEHGSELGLFVTKNLLKIYFDVQVGDLVIMYQNLDDKRSQPCPSEHSKLVIGGNIHKAYVVEGFCMSMSTKKVGMAIEGDQENVDLYFGGDAEGIFHFFLEGDYYTVRDYEE